jgi:hypothetical protein
MEDEIRPKCKVLYYPVFADESEFKGSRTRTASQADDTAPSGSNHLSKKNMRNAFKVDYYISLL